MVYIGADKYEIATLTEEKVYLQNAEFPILGQEYSRADFEEKLTENPANDHLKVVVTEKQRTETPSEKKQDGIQFSIGFSEHPAFYDRQLNDRYTDLSFALGNKLLGILDEKQHREREGDKNIGWYHKTDFVIKAVIGGEEFNYEGRFDIGDGEGDLIAHIKHFYDYTLSPKGEQLYGDDRESLLRGRDEFIPFLEQHTELTSEDEKLLDEIMATENDWYRTAEEAEEKPQAYADKLNGSEAPVIEMEQSTDDLIGREIIIDNRKYLIESIGKISGDVSLCDITFQNNVGFPINRVEKIEYIQKLLEQEKPNYYPKKKRKLLPQTVIISVLPMMPSVSAEQKKSSVTIWRQSTCCTSLKSKTALLHPKNRKSYLGMSVGAVFLWHLMNTMRRGRRSLRSYMPAFPQRNTVPLWSQR